MILITDVESRLRIPQDGVIFLCLPLADRALEDYMYWVKKDGGA